MKEQKSIPFDEKPKEEQFKARGEFEAKERAVEEAIRLWEEKYGRKLSEEEIEKMRQKAQERQETKPFGE